MPNISQAGKAHLDSFIENAARDPNTPPFIFAVTSIEEVIYSKGQGLKQSGMGKDGVVDIDTVYKLCSQSKLITHIAALWLIESGRLASDTPVSQYIPAFDNLIVLSGVSYKPDMATAAVPKAPDRGSPPKFTPATKAMTIEHLMSYTSGLAYPFSGVPDWSQPVEDAYQTPHDASDPVGGFLNYIKGGLPGIPLIFEPGTDWAYGYSSDILGFVVEIVSGMTLEAYMQQNIFRPLGMTSTSFLMNSAIEQNLATIMFRRADKSLIPWGHQFYECDPEKVRAYYGGAALISSARDYLALLRHLLQIHGDEIDASNAILTRESVLKLFTPSLSPEAQKSLEGMLGSVLPAPGTQWSNGQACTVADWPGMRKAGSGFWSGFLNTSFWIDPTTGFAGVVLSQLLPPLDQGLILLAAGMETVLYSVVIN